MPPVHALRLARVRAIYASCGLFLALAITPAFAATPTTTTLSISPSSNVALDTVVTLTAAVTNPGVVTTGTVNFCNVNATDCAPGSGLYGTAQLTSAGTASIKHVFGYGVNNIKAVFLPTTANASSTSLTETVSVAASQIYPSSTTLAASGSAGDYTLSGIVTAFGSELLSGSIHFLDTSNSNMQIGSTSLGLPVYGVSASITYPTGLSPDDVAVADFNGDGKLDLAVPNYSDNTVSILLGNGDGTFQVPVIYPTGLSPSDVAVADFNGDGNLDLVVSNVNDGTVSILLGNGDGTFKPQVTYPAGNEPYSVAVGDLNGDGKLDLVTSGRQTGFISVLLGNGNGTFQSAVNYSVDSTSYSVAVGDLNGDGKLDLVTSNIGTNSISVLLGNGNGTFQSAVNYSVGSTPYSVAVADFNGDGKLDLAVPNYSDNTVSILLGNGDGTFQAQVAYATGQGPQHLSVADFNGDGKLDLAVNGRLGNNISVLLGSGNGTFSTGNTYASSTAPFGISTGDFNGDGIPDIVLTDRLVASVSVLLGEQVASFSESGINVVGTGTHYALASFGGDESRTSSQSSTVPLSADQSAQTINFTAPASPVTFGVAPITLSATASSGLGVTFSVISGPGTVSGSTLTINGTGTVVVAANQAGNSNYTAAPQVTENVSVNKATPAVSVSCNPNPLTYASGNTTCYVSVTGTDGTATGTVNLTINGSAWITSANLINGQYGAGGFNNWSVGSYTIGATYSGDGNYGVATGFTMLSIDPASQSISFTPPASPVTFGLAPITLSATASSGLAVTFSVISGPGSVSGNILTITGAGTVVVAVNQPGDSNNSAAAQVTQSITVISATTAVSLSISPSTNVALNTVVTLTATVTNPSAVTMGTVNFCNPSATACIAGDGLYGTAQLTSAGTATIKHVFGYGANSIKAVFVPTTSNAGSVSAVATVTVQASQIYASSTTLAESGSESNYTLSGTVTAFGSQPLTGTVDFLDTSNSNFQIGATSFSTASPSFVTQGSYATGALPTFGTVGDFNGDGILDFVVANYSSNNVSVLLGNGDGTFQPQVTYATGTHAQAVAVGDFNGDGKLDLAVANIAANTVSILLGNGDGTFQPQVTYATGAAPRMPAVADFNGDGKIDLAIPNYTDGTIFLLLGNGDGTFQPQKVFAAGTTAFLAVAGDFNGDGRPDLMVGCRTLSSVAVLLGEQVASFSKSGINVVGTGTHYALASFGGDGSRTSSQSSTVPLSADQSAQTISFTAPASPVTYGVSPITLSATASSGLAVTFSVISGPGSVSGNVLTITGAGAVVVAANQGGNTNYSAASQITQNIQVNFAASTVTLTSSANPVNYGASVIFTAQTTSTSTGSMTFYDGAALLGTGTMAGGIATYTATGLATGAHSITASYSGDSDYLPAVSTALSQIIVRTPATVGMTSTFSPSTYGQAVTFTFTASGVLGTPSGTVAISDGATLLATPTLNASGVATYTTSDLTVGSHTLTAVYGGDANYK